MIETSGADRSERMIMRVLGCIHDGCVLFDSNLECVFSNGQASVLLGLAPDDFTGSNLRAAFPTALGTEFARAALAAFASRTSARVPLHDESAGRWLQASMHASADGLLAIISDITADKRAQLELQSHAEYLEKLVDQIPAFLWVIDRDLIVRRIEGGRAMLKALDRDRLIGLSQKEVTEMGCNAEDTELSLEMHRRVLRGLSGQYRATWKGITLESRISPLRDPDGSISGIVGVGIDVTEQTRMQEELRGSEERFRAVVEGSADLIAIVDQERRMTYASPSHELVIGYRKSELEAMDLWSLVHPEDVEYVRGQLTTLERSRSVRMSCPVRLRTKEGAWRSFAITLTDLRRYPAVRGIVSNARDVTKELALEAQLRQSQKLEALGQLAGGVAHDFNNVLAAINGFAQLLHEDLAGDDVRRQDVEQILKATERATRITRQLLAFSRHQVPAAARVDLIELVHELSRMLRALLPATIDLRVSPNTGGPAIEVLADRTQLEQVVMNLALNARDAMSAGGTLSIEVRAGTTPQTAHTVILEVRDTGIGMSPEVQAHVFEPFFTTKEPGRGTGLGLATVYGIVRQHLGSIDIASAVGGGTTVTVRLPAAASGAGLVESEIANIERDHTGRVLVVEDEAHVREVAARILRRSGYDVLTAVDAGAALAMLASAESIDVVLTDSAMPGMRGEDLAVEIARIQPGLPVILMSGYADIDRPPPSSVVTAFIQKPFSIAVLLNEVRRAMGRVAPPG